MSACPACGADWSGGQTCTDHFHTLLFWEQDHGLPDVHHLMVLSYHLQHPHLYSPEMLLHAGRMLVDFAENQVSPSEMRRRLAGMVDSGKRSMKITAREGAFGQYTHPVNWTVTIADVVKAGIDEFYPSVRRWAASIIDSLRTSGNLATLQEKIR